MSLNLPQIPVFAFPTSLQFYMNSKSSHTQILTLYSPYSFPVKYKVHCHSTAWDRYVVPTPEGTIPGQSSVELVITHKQPCAAMCNQTDRLKIIIQDPVTERIIGKKTIETILLPGERGHDTLTEDDYEFREIRPQSTQRFSNCATANNQLISSGIVAVCAIILFLPTATEAPSPSNLPQYFHVPHKIQLLAALLLGVFLCILVRS